MKRPSPGPIIALIAIGALFAPPAGAQPAATGPATRRARPQPGPLSPSPEQRLAAARDQLNRSQEELARAAVEMREARDKVGDIRRKMQALSGRIEVSPDVLRQAAVKLEDEQQALELEQAAMSARQEAMEKAAAEAAARAKQAAGNDPVVAELAKVVEARQNAVDHLRKAAERGLASPQDSIAAEAALAEAKAKLAAQREQAVVAAGGDGLAALNRELTNLSIAERERQARLRFIKDRLAKLAQALQLVDELEMSQAAVVRFQHDLEHWDTAARSARFDLERLERAKRD